MNKSAIDKHRKKVKTANTLFKELMGQLSDLKRVHQENRGLKSFANKKIREIIELNKEKIALGSSRDELFDSEKRLRNKLIEIEKERKELLTIKEIKDTKLLIDSIKKDAEKKIKAVKDAASAEIASLKIVFKKMDEALDKSYATNDMLRQKIVDMRFNVPNSYTPTPNPQKPVLNSPDNGLL